MRSRSAERKGATEITAPAEAEAGPAEITLTNNTDADQDGQLAFVAEGEEHTDEEVVGRAAERGPGQAGRGLVPGRRRPRDRRPRASRARPRSSWRRATYYVLPQSEDTSSAEGLTKFTVTGESDAELPEADGTVSAVEYSFSGEGLKAGEQTLLLDNEGGTWHHFLASKLKDGATIEQAKEFLESEGAGRGTAAVRDRGQRRSRAP